jgi:hypothetical protein
MCMRFVEVINEVLHPSMSHESSRAVANDELPRSRRQLIMCGDLRTVHPSHASDIPNTCFWRTLASPHEITLVTERSDDV